MMKVIIDRFEGDFAVVELPDKTMVNMLKILLPSEAKEGDVITITVDKEETKSRKAHIEKLMNDVWED
ncbi:hypothetical protein TSYNTROPHJE_05930 [Tepidanaerobacter syntrophicus]|uniref:DUF3006 domain-containing protein n=1 Tax=Tepidanaerobacter syntrophicus TaxID=224999 RepID=UPI0022EF0324|nr:DUF3006 domain-containing protein [Tepidanaerobacter syntrophicus]GLI18780.1 hypothetical protein TSYNTROPHJE_05930 [Tepidanaerobacter syntrophicus]